MADTAANLAENAGGYVAAGTDVEVVGAATVAELAAIDGANGDGELAYAALADAAARDAKARERALALAPSVPLLPLYAQGLALKAAPEVAGLTFDAQGLPMLDGAWLQPALAPASTRR